MNLKHRAPKTRIDFTIERPLGLTATELETLKGMVRSESTTFNTLDSVEALLRDSFGAVGYYIHRGGHHVALVKNNVRIALVAERSR